MHGSNRTPLQTAIDAGGLTALQYGTFLACWVCAMLDGFDQQSIAFLGPAVMREMRLSTGQFGVTLSVGLIGVVIGTLIQGPVSMLLGRRPVIVASVAGMGLGTLACAFVTAPGQLMLLRLLVGIPLGALIPNIVAMSAEYAPQRSRLLIIGTMFSGFPIGALAGGLVAFAVLPTHGWRAVFFIGGVLPLLISVVLYLALPESIVFLAERQAEIVSGDAGAKLERRILTYLKRMGLDDLPIKADIPTAEAAHWTTDAKLLLAHEHRAGTLLLWLLFFANALALFTLLSWLPVIVTRAGASIRASVVPSVALNLGGIIGGLLLGRLCDRLGAKNVLSIAYGGAVLLCLGSALLVNGVLMSTVLASFVIGISLGGGQAVILGIAAAFYPTGIRTSGLGAAGIAGRMGAVAAPAVGGALLSAGASSTAIFGLSAFGSAVAACAIYTFAGLRTDRCR